MDTFYKAIAMPKDDFRAFALYMMREFNFI